MDIYSLTELVEATPIRSHELSYTNEKLLQPILLICPWSHRGEPEVQPTDPRRARCSSTCVGRVEILVMTGITRQDRIQI